MKGAFPEREVTELSIEFEGHSATQQIPNALIEKMGGMETIINSIRWECKRVFDSCQGKGFGSITVEQQMENFVRENSFDIDTQEYQEWARNMGLEPLKIEALELEKHWNGVLANYRYLRKHNMTIGTVIKRNPRIKPRGPMVTTTYVIEKITRKCMIKTEEVSHVVSPIGFIPVEPEKD